MNHAYYEDLVCLSAIGELEDGDRATLEEHLRSCERCRTELRELQQMQSLVRSAPIEITDAMLREARAGLHAELVKLASRRPMTERIAEAIGDFFAPKYRIAFGAVAMTVLGIVIGHGLFAPSQAQRDEQAMVLHDTSAVIYRAELPASDARPDGQGGTRAENFRILHANERDGIVEFIYDSVTPVRVSGSIRDKHIQRVLASALVDDQNPGVRLKAMNVIMMSQTDQAPEIDGGIKAALVTALKTDENPAVRRQAVVALQQFSHDASVQRALSYALLHDKNAGVRIAAINTLAAASVGGRTIDKAVLNDLRQTALRDNNVFIRNQSRNVLEEASQL
ncbi:MAG TPA: HEAT repeat domain-containing protein [Bacteroidota bacterium]|nr:HEAT repeat domain-containing protein [Bacteroidota bacterium]